MRIRLQATLYTALCLFLLAPPYTVGTEAQPESSQSTEAIKQMADQLETDRKAREAALEQKRKAEEESEKVVGEAPQDNPQPIIQNRPLPQNQPKPRPTPLPAQAK